MGLRALPFSSPNFGVVQTSPRHHRLGSSTKFIVVSAKDGEEPKKRKQSLFSSVTEALDFSHVRSAEDAQLLEKARETTRSGGKMSREQVRLSANSTPISYLHPHPSLSAISHW